MAGFKRDEFIKRLPEVVFSFITDPANAPKLIESVVSMVKITEGSAGVGTRYRETRLMNGKEQQADLEIVAYEPPNSYAVKNVTSGIETVYHYQLYAEDAGTRITLTCELSASGLKKLMLPMVASVLEREDGEHLEKLASALG